MNCETAIKTCKNRRYKKKDCVGQNIEQNNKAGQCLKKLKQTVNDDKFVLYNN